MIKISSIRLSFRDRLMVLLHGTCNTIDETIHDGVLVAYKEGEESARRAYAARRRVYDKRYREHKSTLQKEGQQGSAPEEARVTASTSVI